MSVVVSLRPDTPDVVAMIVEAVNLLRDPNDNVSAGMLARRASYTAAVAIKEGCPHLRWEDVAALIQTDVTSWEFQRSIGRAKSADWWREDVVDELVGMLVAPTYGEQAQ